jgi:hypothetical protein
MNKRLSQRLRISLIGLAIIVALIALTLFNQRFAAQSPGGNDFLPRWLGTRLWLTQARSPYSAETTLAIQQMIYGRAARPAEDQQLFVYPAYTLFLIAPFAWLSDYTWARAAWLTASEIAIIVLALAGLRLANWRLRPIGFASYLLFAVLWYHAVRPVINGNPVVMVALFLTLAMLAIRAGHDGLAGGLLALAAIKPQLCVLIVPWTLWWALWQRRGRIALGWGVTLIGLSGAAAILVPDWLAQNLGQIRAYPGYTVPGTPGAILSTLWPNAGQALGWLITLGLALNAVYLAWTMRHTGIEGFVCVGGWLLAGTQWIGVTTDPTNYIVLFAPLVLVLAALARSNQRLSRLAVGMLSLALGVGIWVLFMATVEYGGQPQQHPIMFVPVPLIVLIGLAGRLHWLPTRSDLKLAQGPS